MPHSPIDFNDPAFARKISAAQRLIIFRARLEEVAGFVRGRPELEELLAQLLVKTLAVQLAVLANAFVNNESDDGGSRSLQ